MADASGYDVFFARCNRSFRLKKSARASTSCVVVTGLDKRESYKAYVRAWKKTGGKKTYIGEASPVVHAITGGYDEKYCNTRSVTLNKTSLTLRVGRSRAIKASLEGVKRGKRPLQHVRKVRWYSSDSNVATVDGNGKVRAVGKGRCTVWAIANNGVRASAKITVK